jgi:hypothetical protein
MMDDCIVRDGDGIITAVNCPLSEVDNRDLLSLFAQLTLVFENMYEAGAEVDDSREYGIMTDVLSEILFRMER